MAETKIFKTRADDFITTGLIPNKTINARYPLAPPWPTEAYMNATIKIRIRNEMVIFMNECFKDNYLKEEKLQRDDIRQSLKLAFSVIFAALF